MIKGIDMELGGKVWTIPPLNLGALEGLEARLQNFTGGLDAASISLVLDAAFMALRRNYRDISREQVAEIVDVANMEAVMEAVMDVSGLKRKTLEPGDLPLGEAAPGRP